MTRSACTPYLRCERSLLAWHFLALHSVCEKKRCRKHFLCLEKNVMRCDCSLAWHFRAPFFGSARRDDYESTLNIKVSSNLLLPCEGARAEPEIDANCIIWRDSFGALLWSLRQRWFWIQYSVDTCDLSGQGAGEGCLKHELKRPCGHAKLIELMVRRAHWISKIALLYSHMQPQRGRTHNHFIHEVLFSIAYSRPTSTKQLINSVNTRPTFSGTQNKKWTKNSRSSTSATLHRSK